ncbi:teichoic acid D-Ala incorporation-associated protein DltX [Bacillus massiliigorillae]|nr:teichoic acid D-Ala incorporation-associated protein DltX [Bacillus massiliigorillae]
MKHLKYYLYHPVALFVYKTIFYLVILLGLLWFYGFKDPNSGGFIYEEF